VTKGVKFGIPCIPVIAFIIFFILFYLVTLSLVLFWLSHFTVTIWYWVSFSLLYSIVNYCLILSFNLWTIYFILDFQWILLLLLFYDSPFVSSSSVGLSTGDGYSTKGAVLPVSSLFNWLIYNFMNSIILINGIVLSNSLFIILVLFSKVGYFPFFVILVYIWFCVSYFFLIYDLMNKLFYFGISVCLIHIDNYLNDFDLYLVLLNLVCILFLLQFVISIKHVVIISSFIFLFILVLIEDELFSLCFCLFYCFIAFISLISLLSFLFFSFLFGF